MKYCIVALWFSTAIFAKPKDKIELEFTSRAAGKYVDGNQLDPVNAQKIDLLSEKLEERNLKDIQIGKDRLYRGVYLKTLIEKIKFPHEDLVLLYFSNGMIIPLSLSDGSLMKVNPFIAVEYKNEDGKWSRKFPALKRLYVDGSNDPRPLKFDGIKLVVTSAWHPSAVHQGEKSFSPWRFPDSLVKVEFAQSEAYYRQFEVEKSAKFAEGMTVFRERCQYCHSVRKIGASYGWDFVDPLPIYKQKLPENLLIHVQYQKVNSVERGIMMPNQSDFTLTQAKALWQWMKISHEKMQKPYQP